ncbi:hypothetical protein L6452_14615 [Arctium lappa]|uniref:Uncharacterized protein n=1 Tax=Arctium lappa TaxID=4217 RepID=A0ACB9CLF8_ARCLA|nr:hypothetical protein L6452_14615 [Arctium lappa]
MTEWPSRRSWRAAANPAAPTSMTTTSQAVTVGIGTDRSIGKTKNEVFNIIEVESQESEGLIPFVME